MAYRPQGPQAAFLSRPQLSGGFGGLPQEGKGAVIQKEQRHRMNVSALCQCLFFPWLFFCAVYALMSCNLHFYRPLLCYGLVGLCSLVVLAVGWLAMGTLSGRLAATREPSWYMFLFITMLIAFVLGVVFGSLNFSANLQQYYDYANLDVFYEVSPELTSGTQIMDAGRVHFNKNSTLDVTKSMGFKNVDTYCVAPVSVTTGGVTKPLETYDFWAVGIGCCSLNTADFHCGEFGNRNAHSGLRLMQDEQRDFFRLAVQQAEAAYGIKATHPLFFYWVENATAEMNSFKDDGYKYYLIGMLAHFSWQSFCVVLAVAGYSKIGY
ncbi:unnamed protein product [Polarella glacialis]|uniref:Uncharacterized protein n=1 Tax=Polarella glacialis TaxID=89957 RepID=A0A813L3A2_POLGL|nr:unnamed protein product [Polarella glacialis]|eukprot:CAMPEP_0115067620 /NCGR_PEP_ID=MMETSP0227-20121206/11502_1 /TAXON_ID=89957 /ORGANISM="Polarella glacialis, Strain CCMP 1383" /LENGTH=321 /DNA_ID=CAMNT_0002453729 /DNA_START=73 /DNA_END=1038 /DNA_ORIENTATION=-